MFKHLRYLACILMLLMAVSSITSAQDAGFAAATNSTSDNNSSTSNNTTTNETKVQPSTATDSAGQPMKLDSAMKGSENLSTISGEDITVAEISEMAGAAPLVAAGASSAQVSGEGTTSFKIGSGVGGLDPFKPKHLEVQPLSLGIETKPMRDTGKMFFVCDIV